MPKVKNLYGINSLSTIKPSPRNTGRQSYSQTQPQTQRQNLKTEEIECDRRECLTQKWTNIQNQNIIAQLQKELDKYKGLYIKERKKIGDTYKEIENIMEVLQKKEINIRQKDLELKDKIQKQQEIQLKNESTKTQLNDLTKELNEKEKEIQTEQSKQLMTMENQKIIHNDLKLLKQTLESSVEYLKEQEKTMFISLEQLASQEQEAMKRIKNLNDFLDNTGNHFKSLQAIESLLDNKCNHIDQLQQSAIQKQEELIYFDQQLQLRSMCTSLNEQAFYKRIGTQTERAFPLQKTPSEDSSCRNNTKGGQFFKNQQPENLIISTINSRENSPYSKESFRLIKKQFNLQSSRQISNVMQELNV